jgi:transcriptional regulator with XRE-family HTH domain
MMTSRSERVRVRENHQTSRGIMIEDRLTLNFQIAERLRLARSASSLSLAQLSDRTEGKVSVSMISNYERAQRRIGIEEACLLAKALGTVTPGYLLCVEPLMRFSPDELDLLGMYRKADARGRALIRETAMIESDPTR